MGSRHVASESISSAIAGPSVANKRRTAGQQLAPGQKTATAGGDSKMFGLGLAHQQSSMQFAATPSSRPSSPANSISYSSRPSSPSDGDCSSTSQHEVERGSSSYRYRSAPSSSQNTPSRRKSTSSSVRNHETSRWQPFSQSSWTPEKPKMPTLRTEDALSMDVLFQTHESPYRIQSAHPNLYRSPSSSSLFYRSDSMPMIASTSQSSTSTYESTLSPSASFSTLTPSKASLDPRRNSDTTLSIAPSPPMPSSSFQPHHLSSPNSLTNRTSPKSGPHKRSDSLTSACMPISSSTSSFFASARPRPSVDLARDKLEEPRQTSNNKHEHKRRGRWSTLSWKTRKRSPSDDGETALGYISQHTACRLCLAMASACLGPLYSTIFPDHSTRQHQKQISSQSRHGQVSSRKRWQSQAFRGFLGLYIFYSLFLFTSRLYAIPLSSKSLKITKRGHVDTRPVASEYNSWQQARFKLLDVYNVAADAIGSTALRLGRQTSKAAAGDFAGDSHGANSLNNLMLLDQLPEVRRQWGETSKPILLLS